jgi:hypothetical protein
MLGLGRLFADDTSIGHTAHDETTLTHMINIDHKYIQEWLKRWLVKFNPSKTDIMIFSANNQQNDLTFDFNSTLIQIVNTHTHLGVIFSCACKWTKHINTIIERASKQLNILRKLKFKLNRQYLENIYLSIPPTVAESNNYNRHNISQPANRLSSYQNSFFPSTIKTWNTLDFNIREVPTFFTFKKRLKYKYFRNKKIPCYFSSGDRYLNVLQSRLRNRCSALNIDLYHANLIPYALC